jgi:hypothetical protein
MHLFIVRILLLTLVHKIKIVGLMSTIGLPNVEPLIKMTKWNLSIVFLPTGLYRSNSIGN